MKSSLTLVRSTSVMLALAYAGFMGPSWATTATPTKPAAAAPPTVSQAGAVSQNSALALAKKSGCMACHTLDKKLVGPAWKDVAAKYKGAAGAEAKLVEKVKKGGSGVWGKTPMPANSPRVSDTDITTMVKFVLSLK